MHILLVTSSTDIVGSVRRLLGGAPWILATLGAEATVPDIEKALANTPAMDLAPYDAIIFIGVLGMAHRTVYTIAKQIIEREYTGRLIAVAKKDEVGSPSEARRNFRNVGIRDDQFAPTLEAAIRMLNT